MERIERISSFRAMPRTVERPIGMSTAPIGPALAEIAGHAGSDFVAVNDEHCPITPELVIAMVRAAESAGVQPGGAASLPCHVGARVRRSTVAVGRPVRSGISLAEYAS